jgi:hypothetical protein
MNTIILKLILFIQWAGTCFGQPCGHLQAYKIQRLDCVCKTNFSVLVRISWYHSCIHLVNARVMDHRKGVFNVG